MKKVFFLVSLVLVLGLVIGCPQPNDSGNGGGVNGRTPLTNEQGQTLMKATLEGTEITLTPVYEGETGGLTLKSALNAVVDDSNRANITKITIVAPEGGAKIIPEADLFGLFYDTDGNSKPIFYVRLASISGLEYLDTSNVTSMRYIFSGTKALSSLDLSVWNTSNVNNMEGAFSNSGLTVLNLSNWNTTKVMSSDFMFDYVLLAEVTVGSNLTISISNKILPRHGGDVGREGYANPGKWVKDGEEYDTIPVVDGKAVAGTYTAKLAG